MDTGIPYSSMWPLIASGPIVIRCVLSSAKCTKTCFRPGLCPEPRLGAYDALPDLLVRWGGDTPSRYLSSIDASISSLRQQHLGI